ncbi:MAG: M12 family metallo-peptidase [Phycisphaerales bacterium]
MFASNASVQVQIEGGSVTLIPERTARQASINATSVRGRAGEAGSFVLGHGPTGIEGAIWIDDLIYTIRGMHDGPLRIEAFNHRHDEAECPGGVRPSVSDHGVGNSVSPRLSDAVSTSGAIEPTRVLVVYNADARDDVADIDAYIAAMIESANEAYDNSVTDQVEIVLAGAYLMDEQFSDDFGTVLRQVTNRHDSVGDTMHSLRDATDADVIAMLVDQSGYCGLAWLAPGNAEYAMSVSHIGCALGNLTFAHELGHNQGCAHDPDNSSSSSAPYGYGHRWDNNSQRSVMAYAPGTRVPHFSNPDVLYDGFPTGIANQRDNARVLDETHAAMAANRSGDGTGTDEDFSGTPDRLEIALDPSLDLDRDGQLDSIQIQNNPSLDCNNDGLIDAEQVYPRVRVVVGTTTQFGSGIEPEFSTAQLPIPATDISIEVGVVGDIGESNESLTLVFNDGLFVTEVYAESFTDCYAPGALRAVVAEPAQFAQILNEGIDLRVIPSSSVSATTCSNPNLTVWVEYRTHDLALDANGDGVIDSCSCVADLNGDGELNFFDVAAYIAAYQSMDPIADFDGNGLFNFFDVSDFLVAFGEGCP